MADVQTNEDRSVAQDIENARTGVSDADTQQETTTDASSVAQTTQPDPNFTQEDLNRILASHRRSLQSENTDLKTQLGSMQEDMSSLKNMLSDAAKDAGVELSPEGELISPDGDRYSSTPEGYDEYVKMMTPPKGVNGELWRTVQGVRVGHENQMSDVKDQLSENQKQLQQALDTLQEERSIRLKAEDTMRTTQRDNLLTDALTRSNCADLTAGIRYFTPESKYVDGVGWMFVPKGATETHEYIPLEDAVNKYIPPVLVRSASSQGGSGAQEQTTSSESVDADINQQESLVKELYDRAQMSKGETRAVSAYMSANRKLTDLRKSKDGSGN
jgi:hypothetical protein